eukprot:COSAG02_NODE_45061_length_360_cov_1.214559_1_plen_35_part_01
MANITGTNLCGIGTKSETAIALRANAPSSVTLRVP